MNFSLFSTRRRFARLFNIYQVQLSTNLLHILRKWVEAFTPVTLVLTMPISNTFITPSESDEAEHDIFRTEFAVVWRLRFAKFDQWLEGSNPANAPWITTMFTTWSSWVSTTNYHRVMTPVEFVLFDLSSFKNVHFGRAIKMAFDFKRFERKLTRILRRTEFIVFRTVLSNSPTVELWHHLSHHSDCKNKALEYVRQGRKNPVILVDQSKTWGFWSE